MRWLHYVQSPGKSVAGQTGQRICALDGSNDTDSRKDVPFWDFVDIAVHLRDRFLKTTIFGVQVDIFKPNIRKIQTFIFSKLLHRLQPDFAH